MAEDNDQLTNDVASRIAWGVQSPAEHRWPASVAVLVAMAVYVALPGRYELGPSWLIPVLEMIIVLPLSVTAPRRVAHEGQLLQVMALVMIAIVNIANLASLVLLVNV